jgi:hypothetical protein
MWANLVEMWVHSECTSPLHSIKFLPPNVIHLFNLLHSINILRLLILHFLHLRNNPTTARSPNIIFEIYHDLIVQDTSSSEA